MLEKLVGPRKALQMCPSQCIAPPGFEDTVQDIVMDRDWNGKGEKRRLESQSSSPHKVKMAKLTESLQEILDEAGID